MTYIVGILEENEVIMIADSAVTEEGKNRSPFPRTSMGEMCVERDQEVIYQSGLKLFNIEGNMIIGGAGCASVIDNFVTELKIKLGYKSFPIEECIELTMESFEDQSSEYSLLIAYTDEENKSQLRKKEIDETTLTNCPSFSFIGCDSEHAKRFIDNYTELSKNIHDKQLCIENRMVLYTSILQGYGQFDYLLEDNVGGVFTAAALTNGKVRWQPNVGYIIYNVNNNATEDELVDENKINLGRLFKESKYIFIGEYDNSFFVYAPKDSYTGPLFNTIDCKTEEDREKWFKSNMVSIEEDYTNMYVDYFVFVSSNNRIINVLNRDKLKEYGIKMSYGEKVTFSFRSSDNDKKDQFFDLLYNLKTKRDMELTLIYNH